jgi:DNA-binding transcriptional LysR family regulator
LIAPIRDFVKDLTAELKVVAPNVTITPVYEVSYVATAIGMAAAGLGITVGPSYAARLAKGYRLQMRPVFDPVFFRAVSVYNMAAKSLSPAASSFYDVLIKVAAEDIQPK